VTVSARRTRIDWAHCIKDLVDVCYPDAEQIVLVLEYVPRNIFQVLCPAALCDRRRHGGAYGQAAGSRCRRCRPHNDQSEASQLSRVSSVCQMGLTRGSAEVPGGWVARSASILVLVLISA